MYNKVLVHNVETPKFTITVQKHHNHAKTKGGPNTEVYKPVAPYNKHTATAKYNKAPKCKQSQ